MPWRFTPHRQANPLGDLIQPSSFARPVLLWCVRVTETGRELAWYALFALGDEFAIYRLSIDEAPEIIDGRRYYLAVESIDNLSTRVENLSMGR